MHLRTNMPGSKTIIYRQHSGVHRYKHADQKTTTSAAIQQTRRRVRLTARTGTAHGASAGEIPLAALDCENVWMNKTNTLWKKRLMEQGKMRMASEAMM